MTLDDAQFDEEGLRSLMAALAKEPDSQEISGDPRWSTLETKVDKSVAELLPADLLEQTLSLEDNAVICAVAIWADGYLERISSDAATLQGAAGETTTLIVTFRDAASMIRAAGTALARVLHGDGGGFAERAEALVVLFRIAVAIWVSGAAP